MECGKCDGHILQAGGGSAQAVGKTQWPFMNVDSVWPLAGTLTLQSSPESGQRLLAGSQGTKCPLSCRWFLPARLPGGLRMEGEAALGMVPRTSSPFYHMRRCTHLLHSPVHSLACSLVQGHLVSLLHWPPSLGSHQVGWPSPGEVAAYCTLKAGLPGLLCNTTEAPRDHCLVQAS